MLPYWSSNNIHLTYHGSNLWENFLPMLTDTSPRNINLIMIILLVAFICLFRRRHFRHDRHLKLIIILRILMRMLCTVETHRSHLALSMHLVRMNTHYLWTSKRNTSFTDLCYLRTPNQV